MTRKQRVARVVYGGYVVLVAAFVVSNIYQVGSALFGSNGGAAVARADVPKVGPACGAAIEAELEAIERARLAATSEPSADAARARYAAERERTRSRDLEPACSREPNGADAVAALARFDRAAASHALRTADELSPVRLSTQSFISGHPR